MKPIEDLMVSFEYGVIKSVACLCGSAVSFIASTQIPDTLTSNAAGVTGWALAISCIVVLANTVKHLFQKLEEKDKKIEQLHGDVLEATKDQQEE